MGFLSCYGALLTTSQVLFEVLKGMGALSLVGRAGREPDRDRAGLGRRYRCWDQRIGS